MSDLKKENNIHLISKPIRKEDRFVWNVLIREGEHNFQMPVYRREGIKHKHGEWNNCDPELWLLRDKSALQLKLWEIDPNNEQGLYRQEKSELLKPENRWQWVPWGDRFAKSVHWSFTFETYNRIDHYSKYGSDEYSVKTGGLCRMYCNGREIYSFIARDMEYMIARARHLSLDFELWGGIDPHDPDKVIGRKVWYHDQEGVVVRHYLPEDRIVIKSEKPDGTGFDLNKKRDAENDWPKSEWNGSQEVHTGIFDSNIYWYRK